MRFNQLNDNHHTLKYKLHKIGKHWLTIAGLRGNDTDVTTSSSVNHTYQSAQSSAPKVMKTVMPHQDAVQPDITASMAQPNLTHVKPQAIQNNHQYQPLEMEFAWVNNLQHQYETIEQSIQLLQTFDDSQTAMVKSFQANYQLLDPLITFENECVNQPLTEQQQGQWIMLVNNYTQNVDFEPWLDQSEIDNATKSMASMQSNYQDTINDLKYSQQLTLAQTEESANASIESLAQSAAEQAVKQAIKQGNAMDKTISETELQSIADNATSVATSNGQQSVAQLLDSMKASQQAKYQTTIDSLESNHTDPKRELINQLPKAYHTWLQNWTAQIQKHQSSAESMAIQSVNDTEIKKISNSLANSYNEQLVFLKSNGKSAQQSYLNSMKASLSASYVNEVAAQLNGTKDDAKSTAHQWAIRHINQTVQSLGQKFKRDVAEEKANLAPQYEASLAHLSNAYQSSVAILNQQHQQALSNQAVSIANSVTTDLKTQHDYELNSVTESLESELSSSAASTTANALTQQSAQLSNVYTAAIQSANENVSAVTQSYQTMTATLQSSMAESATEQLNQQLSSQAKNLTQRANQSLDSMEKSAAKELKHQLGTQSNGMAKSYQSRLNTAIKQAVRKTSHSLTASYKTTLTSTTSALNASAEYEKSNALATQFDSLTNQYDAQVSATINSVIDTTTESLATSYTRVLNSTQDSINDAASSQASTAIASNINSLTSAYQHRESKAISNAINKTKTRLAQSYHNQMKTLQKSIAIIDSKQAKQALSSQSSHLAKSYQSVAKSQISQAVDSVKTSMNADMAHQLFDVKSEVAKSMTNSMAKDTASQVARVQHSANLALRNQSKQYANTTARDNYKASQAARQQTNTIVKTVLQSYASSAKSNAAVTAKSYDNRILQLQYDITKRAHSFANYQIHMGQMQQMALSAHRKYVINSAQALQSVHDQIAIHSLAASAATYASTIDSSAALVKHRYRRQLSAANEQTENLNIRLTVAHHEAKQTIASYAADSEMNEELLDSFASNADSQHASYAALASKMVNSYSTATHKIAESYAATFNSKYNKMSSSYQSDLNSMGILVAKTVNDAKTKLMKQKASYAIEKHTYTQTMTSSYEETMSLATASYNSVMNSTNSSAEMAIRNAAYSAANSMSIKYHGKLAKVQIQHNSIVNSLHESYAQRYERDNLNIPSHLAPSMAPNANSSDSDN